VCFPSSVISVTILDDTQPELVKTVVVRLSGVTGGATIKYDNSTIRIMESDHVAGVLSLSSTSLPAKEGMIVFYFKLLIFHDCFFCVCVYPDTD